MDESQTEALKNFDRAFSNFINASFDPWQVDLWRDEVWEARKRMGECWDVVRNEIIKKEK